MDTIQIIEFQPEYEQPVKDLIHLVLRSLGITNKYPEINRDTDLDYILEKYKDRGRFWLAIRGKELVGTVAIEEKDHNIAKLKRMFVLPEFQGSGIGQKLFDTALNFAKNNGYKTLRLNTDKIMNRAHRFYEKNGFRKIGEDDDRLFYELDLTSNSNRE